MTSSKSTLTSAAAAEAIVREFDALGGHRTGSPGDNATTELLIRRLSEVGVEAQVHRFRFSKLEATRAEV
jgi:hypothetical protein